jgi:hypothetical protein
MSLLPAAFADLEPYAAMWCLPSEPDRYAQRLASTMGEIQAFYDAVTPRAEEALSYCDQFACDDMPTEVVNLMHLLYSMVMVSFPIEVWRQPGIPDSGATTLECVGEPIP